MALGVGLWSGCADGPRGDGGAVDSGSLLDDTVDEPVWPVWEDDVELLIAENCTACHRGSAPEGGLDLSGDIRPGTVGVAAVQAEAVDLIAPGDHLRSYLWHKVNGSQSLAGGSGTHMPIGTWLPESDIERLAWWIDAGCP